MNHSQNFGVKGWPRKASLVRFIPCCARCPAPDWPLLSDLQRVGSNPRLLIPARLNLSLPLCPLSRVKQFPLAFVFVKVGNEEESFAEVWASHSGNAESVPPRSIPDFGKFTDDQCKSLASDDWGVFQEHESRSNLANDSEHFEDKLASWVIQPGTLARC